MAGTRESTFPPISLLLVMAKAAVGHGVRGHYCWWASRNTDFNLDQMGKCRREEVYFDQRTTAEIWRNPWQEGKFKNILEKPVYPRNILEALEMIPHIFLLIPKLIRLRGKENGSSWVISHLFWAESTLESVGWTKKVRVREQKHFFLWPIGSKILFGNFYERLVHGAVSWLCQLFYYFNFRVGKNPKTQRIHAVAQANIWSLTPKAISDDKFSITRQLCHI